jgi:lysozyme family protein
MANFDKILKRTLIWEGGFSDHPSDPGGRTMKGVIQKVYDAWRTKHQLPIQDVKLIEDNELSDIYYNDYYLPVHGDLFETDIRVQWKVFDIGVNMGVRRSIRFVQKEIDVLDDGSFGPKSQEALKKYQENWDFSIWGDKMLTSLIDQQTQRYKNLIVLNPKLSVFLNGWMRRAADNGSGLV